MLHEADMNFFRHKLGTNRKHWPMALLLSLLSLSSGSTALADEPCGVWKHAGWGPNYPFVTWTIDGNGDPQPSIGQINEVCSWDDPCEGTLKENQNNLRSFSKWSDTVYHYGGNNYERRVQYVAYPGCEGGLPTFASGTSGLPVHWAVGDAISGGDLVGASTRNAAPGASVSVSVTTATDSDSWSVTGGGTGTASDGIRYKWTSSNGGSFPGGDTGSAVAWKAPFTPGTYTLTCTVDDSWDAGQTGVTLPHRGNRNDAPITRTVTVNVWSASVQVKRRDASPDDYGSSATVAAGHVTNKAHQVDIEVTIKTPDNQPVVGVTPNKAVITSKGLGKYDNPAVIATISDFSATNAQGKATATFTSGLRIDETVGIKLPYDSSQPSGSTGPTASIWQTWGSGTWAYDPYYYYDIPSELSYSMKLLDGTPIAGHNVSFITTAISGWEWDDEEGEDWDDDGFSDGNYVYNTYSNEDANLNGWDEWKHLSTFVLGNESGTGGGTYNAEQTIHWDDDFIADYVEFDMNDDSVYDEGGHDFERQIP
jgi:hypothetical protein